MIVVADTSPINYLVSINEIAVLPKLYGTVIIPPAVRDELSRDRAPEIVRRWIASPAAQVRKLVETISMEKVMTNPEKTPKPEVSMSAMNAIYHRRAVRDYTPQNIDQAVIRMLLDAAVHAPTAVHEEPWAFAVIQDKDTLNRLSDNVKALLADGTDPIHPTGGSHTHDRFTVPEFNAFHNAGTLIVICGKPLGPFVVADCWLAAENLMIAACANGLGTCPIGLSVTALNTPEWKTELKIPAEMTAFAPIIVGVPTGETPAVPRKQPEILSWK